MQVSHADSDFLAPFQAAPFPQPSEAWDAAGGIGCGDACDAVGMSKAFANARLPCAITAQGDSNCRLSMADMLSLASLLLPTTMPRNGHDAAILSRDVDGRSQLTSRLGADMARQLQLAAADYTDAELTALGEQVVLDHVLHGDDSGAQLAIELARTAGRLDADALARGDHEKIAEQAYSFVQAEFEDAFAVHGALARLAQFDMPSRRDLARKSLVGIQLDPRRLVDTPELIDPDNPLAQIGRKTAADYYFNNDALSAVDIQRMSGRPLSHGEAEGIRARLPASLDAEFGKRFDRYAADMSAATVKLLDAWLSAVARKYGINLLDATVAISRPQLQYYGQEVAVLRGSAFLYDGKTRAEVPGQGFIVDIRRAGAAHRYYFCASTGAVRALAVTDSADAWVHDHRDEVFGDTAIAALEARKDLSRSRVHLERLGEGPHATLAEWAMPAFRTDIEKARETARGLTPGEAAIETLLNFIPFRALAVAIRKGDVETALVAGGLDVLSLIPLTGMGVRLASAVIKRGVPVVRLAGMHASTSLASLRGLATRMPALRAAMRASVSRAAARTLGRARPLDAERIATALRASHPRLAQALDNAAARARGSAVRAGWWQVKNAHVSLSTGDEAIAAAQPIQAQGRHGGELSVLAYGEGSMAYTRYDAAAAGRTGAILLPDRAGWLYPSLPMAVLERYRVSAPVVLHDLKGLRPQARGTIALDGKDYARIGNDYVEVVPDRAASVAGRPVWRVAAPDGVSPDSLAHRLVHDAENAIWRMAEPPALNGGGGICSLQRASVNVDDREALNAATDASFHTTLLRHIEEPITNEQLNRLKALLAKFQTDPRGAAILRGMRAYYETFDTAPEIVIRDGPDLLRPRPSLDEPIIGKRWYLDLAALENEPIDSAVWELAAVYNNMTGILHDVDPYAEVMQRPGQGSTSASGLDKAWQAWVADGSRHGIHEGLKRQRVVDRIKWQLREAKCYGGMNKASFQALLRRGVCPAGISIDLSHAELKSVPPLPEDVRILNVAYNEITDWRHLAKRLTALDISGNVLTALPANLPDGLLELNASDNYLEQLPTGMPPGLRQLVLARNRFTELADVLPEGLVSLRLDENRSLARLPRLPDTLKHLDVSFTNLETLPATLPPGLETLEAARSNLRRLPASLPAGLRMLDLLGNGLTALPDCINALVSCRIDLSENPIPSTSIPRPTVGRPGPRIFFSGETTAKRSDRIIEAVEWWLNGQEAEAAARWNTIGLAVEADPHAQPAGAAFRAFLDRMRGTGWVDAIRPEVVEWLVALSQPEREALRTATFGACIAPAEMCQGRLTWCVDRVGWTMNQLRGLRLNDDIALGHYDDRPQAVVEAARQMFRLDALNEIAWRKVKEIGREEEALEVYLAYAVKLRDALHLTTVMPHMRYYSVSGITDDDLGQALLTVQSRERAGFEQYLAVDYEPWRTLLKRRMTERYESAVGSMHELVEQRLEPAIQAELAALGLPPEDTAAREDARKDMGPRLTRDIQYSVLGPLTREYLASIES
jgi:hypothetical protein